MLTATGTSRSMPADDNPRMPISEDHPPVVERETRLNLAELGFYDYRPRAALGFELLGEEFDAIELAATMLALITGSMAVHFQSMPQGGWEYLEPDVERDGSGGDAGYVGPPCAPGAVSPAPCGRSSARQVKS